MSEEFSALDKAQNFYELAKIANPTNLIAQDFINTICLAMFKNYITSFEHPELALDIFMTEWEDKIITEKELEIASLLEQQDSLEDMVISAKIAESQDLEEFKNNVEEFSDFMSHTISSTFNDLDK